MLWGNSASLVKSISFISALLASLLSGCATSSLTNPKELVPPVMLTRADYYLDGGSLGGTLRDSRGRHLDFFFDRGLGNTAGKTYIGFVSGHRTKAMEAHFKGWQVNDLYVIIQRTIRDQFIEDATGKELRPKEPTAYSFEEVNLSAVRRILRHVEQEFHPERSKTN